MLKEKKLYLALLLLLAFALIGEQPKMKQDLRRTATGLMRLLQVDEIVKECGPFIETASRISKRLLSGRAA